jgi:hypothetical protein
MFDSLILRRESPSLRECVLSQFVQRGERAFYRKTDAEYSPTLFHRRSEDGKCYSAIELSLPKFLFGNNIQTLKKSDLEPALLLVSEFASDHFGFQFDALTANVGRIDFQYNFQVGEDRIYSYLKAASEAEPNFLKRRIIGKIETVDFFNKSRKITLYDKFRESQRQFAKDRISKEILEMAHGILRLEVRFNNTESVKRMANRFNLPNIQAQTILDFTVAKSVLTAAVESLALNKPIIAADNRISKLQQRYGFSSRLQRLVGFLTLCDIFGFSKLIDLGVMKNSAYYRHRKEVFDADALVFSDFDSELAELIVR